MTVRSRMQRCRPFPISDSRCRLFLPRGKAPGRRSNIGLLRQEEFSFHSAEAMTTSSKGGTNPMARWLLPFNIPHAPALRPQIEIPPGITTRFFLSMTFCFRFDGFPRTQVRIRYTLVRAEGVSWYKVLRP